MVITTSMIKELWKATGASLLDCRKALQANAGNSEKAAEYLREKGLAQAAQKASRETKAGLVIVKQAGDNACAVQVDCETDFVARTDDFKTFVHRVADQVLADAGLTDAEKLLAANLSDSGKTVADINQELVSKLGENIIVRRVARYTVDGAGIIEGYVHAGDIEGYGPMEGRIGVLVELGMGHAASTGRDALGNLAHELVLQIAAANPGYLSPDDIPDDVMQKERETLVTQLAEKDKPDYVKAEIVQGQLDKFYQQVCLLKQAFVKDDSVSIQELLQQKSRRIGTPVTVNRFARLEVGV